MIPPTIFRSLMLMLSLLIGCSVGQAQDRYFPLDPARMPTGQAAQWRVLSAPQIYGHVQPVRIQLPSTGHVSFFQGSPQNRVLTQAPSQVGMLVGQTYRIQVSGMPEYPGVELYPTIELLDRLHPPEGASESFPIPVEISVEEIAMVLEERMVTKVIYLEQPDLAAPFDQGDRIRVEDLPVTENLLESADRRGRPMAILRIGGRVPDPNSDIDEFYSQSPLSLQPQQ